MSTTIIPADAAIGSFRKSGYRSTGHALAELIDNSLQAKAKLVTVLIQEDIDQNSRAQKLGIFDNGSGMDKKTLSIALQVGGGSRKEATTGIGKFGMGLPMASLSVARRVDVWSWQNGEDPLYCYLDVDEVEGGDQIELPDPVKKKIPKSWLDRIKVKGKLSKSGTIVVWSGCDNLSAVWGQTLYKHTSAHIGRMYNKLIGRGKSQITFDVFGGRESFQDEIRAVDPLHLKVNKSFPAPWNSKPLFQQYKKDIEIDVRKLGWTYLKDGASSIVKLRFSYAKKDVQLVNGKAGGNMAHGKLLKDMWGVSFVRAERELKFDRQQADDSGYRDRWRSAEISFEPSLDELFDVDNAKQDAVRLTEFIRLKKLAENSKEWDDVYHQYVDQPGGEGGAIGIKNALAASIMHKIVTKIWQNNSEMHDMLKTQQKQTKREHNKSQGAGDVAIKRATKAAEGRNAQGHHNEQGKTAEGLSEVEQKAQLRGFLELAQVGDDEIALIMENLADSSYDIIPSDLGSPNILFWPTTLAGKTIVKVNTAHPMYKGLYSVLDGVSDEDNDDIDKVIAKLSEARVTLKLMLLAYARMEDETKSDNDSQITITRAEMAGEVREFWGQILKTFLQTQI